MKKIKLTKKSVANMLVTATMLATIAPASLAVVGQAGIVYAEEGSTEESSTEESSTEESSTEEPGGPGLSEVGKVVADETSKRSITIHKYQISDLSELGEAGDGTIDESVDKLPLSGVTFKLQRVEPVDNVSLVDGKEQKEGTDYTIDESFVAMEGVTNEAGIIEWDLGVGTANDGIYLVTELDTARPEGPQVDYPADPFFVYVPQTNREDLGSLIYDIHVQPKNMLETLLEPNKTIEGTTDYSIKAGEDFKWELEANIPNGLHQVLKHDSLINVWNSETEQFDEVEFKAGDEIYGDYYTIEDTLNEQLKIGKIEVFGKTADGDWEIIDEESTEVDEEGNAAPNYSIAIDEATNKVTMNLEKAGMKLFNTTKKYTQIKVEIHTTVDQDFNGTISNDFGVSYLVPGRKPVEPVTPPVKPEYHTGGFDIEKTAEGTNELLADAEFHLAATEQDAKDEIYIATDGKSYHIDAELPEGVEFLVAITDEKGFAEFNGLALDPEVDENGELVSASRDYWLVETKAPEGYELIKQPVKIKVTLETADDAEIEANIIDKAKTKLPFTGGQGTTLMVAIAIGAITLGTAMVTIDKKRRA